MREELRRRLDEHLRGPSTAEAARLSRWIFDGETQALAGYLLGRWQVDVPPDRIEDWIRNRRNRERIVNPREWLKNRLIEDGFLPPGYEGAPEVRLAVLLHVDPTSEPGDPDLAEMLREYVDRAHLQRPAFFRRPEKEPSGITVAARRLVGEERQHCPYCRASYRNPNALVLHLEQRHGEELERGDRTKC